MKAVYADQPFKIKIRDISIPQVAPSEVLIHVAYAGICGSDLHAYRGTHAFRKPPVMLGHELSGRIAAMGSQVTGLRIGENVTVMPQVGCGMCSACLRHRVNLCANKMLPGTAGWIGACGEYFVAPASVVCPLDEVPLDLGAITEPLAVAVHVIEQLPRDHGQDLLILGAGAIGLLLLMIAPEYGFSRIMVTDIVDENLALAKELGAARAVNVLHEDPDQAARSLFGPQGAENTIIAAGGPGILAQAIQIAKPGGSIVYFAMITQEMTLNTYPIVFKELHLSGSLNYTLDDFTSAIGLLKKRGNQIRRIITQILPLEQAAMAFEILDKKTQFAVKILLQNTEEDLA